MEFSLMQVVFCKMLTSQSISVMCLYADTFVRFLCRLYITTSMANPHYLPSVVIQVNIINFTVTFEGLQEQLLSAVVKHVSFVNAIQICCSLPTHL